ncbi:MAG TPA: hypothetical protein VGO40_08150 [Longimicrobium sp.]|jgi:hypothetical protein|nr:hypothetical protein [Longimicrobium sp.]
MQKLDLNSLEVDTFHTMSDDGSTPVVFNGPPVTQGYECTVTLNGSCTCYCHTPRYDCV